MKKSLALLLVLTLMLALLAGCASTGNAGASDEKVIKIGVFEPVTGAELVKIVVANSQIFLLAC